MQSPVVPHRSSPHFRNIKRGVSPLLRDYHQIQSLRKDSDQLEDDESKPSTKFSQLFERENLITIGFCILLIFIVVSEVLLRRANTYIYMRNYRTFLNQILVFSCVIAFAVIIYVKKYFGNDPSPLNSRLIIWFICICIFDTLATFMIILSSASITAPLSLLLQQGAIPLSMLFSALWLHKTYKFPHYIGAIILLIGIGISIGVTFAHSEPGSSSFGWAVIFFLSNIPIAVGSILKELILSHPESEKRAEMNQLNFWVALFQFFVGMVLYPAGYILQDPDQHLIASDVPSNIAGGFKCWFAGTNTIISDDCSLSWLVWFHILFVVLLNIIILIVIMRGSAVLLFIATAVSIPCTTLFSSFAFMGPLQVQFEWYDVIATILTLAGLIIYRLKPEEE